MSKPTCSASYHVLKSDPELNEPPALLAEDESEADDDEGTNKSPLWKALINLMGDLEGTGTLALPYAISQSGLIALSGLIIIPFIAFYTGAILIDCLYDQNDAGERVRVRSNYKQLGEACSSRYSGTIVSAIQLIHLFLVASLYLVVCASLATGIFPDLPLSDKFWMFIAAAVVLPTLFLKDFSQVAWLSLINVIGFYIAVITVLSYGITHHLSWNPIKISVWDIESAPVSLAVISYSYICHSTLPGLEASMENRSQYRPMLGLAFFFAAMMKVIFSVFAFLSFSPNIQEVISNSLPMGVIRTLVNTSLILSVVFSYPFLVISIIQIIEDLVSEDCFSLKIPRIVWFVGIRVATNFLTLLPAILIPHFALFMAFISSLTGSATMFILPALFHLILKKKDLKLYHYIFDILILIFGVYVGVVGLLYTGKSLFKTIFHDN
ncbi:vesicular inhibitory amino acid transporter-like [Porites lutea]|uniref:vesicular inhibitory amino acid transporter-like n=1 Tax=Porites lutea TaxID=51062 RepID=UPI003CC53E6F